MQFPRCFSTRRGGRKKPRKSKTEEKEKGRAGLQSAAAKGEIRYTWSETDCTLGKDFQRSTEEGVLGGERPKRREDQRSTEKKESRGG